jgi:nucleotide-binding universal stress UspA family protein
MQCDSYPFTRILIPFDASASAQRALDWAAHLARAGGEALEKVTLLRVIGGGYLARHIQNVDLRVTRMDQVDAWRRVRQRHLDHEIQPSLDEAKNLLQEKGLAASVETRIAEGRIGEEIIRLASEDGYNTIIMGQRGLSPVKELLLGSVTRQVLSMAHKTTVFVVGQEAAFDPDCAVSPMLLPVDGSEPSLAAVRQGALLARGLKTCQPRLTLLHVMDIAQVTSAPGETSSLLHAGESILEKSRQTLQETCRLETVEDKLLIGDPPRVITAEAEEGHYGLILMGARGLSPLKQLFLGSVSVDVLHRASRAVVGIVYL